ncbi:MAG: 5-formyltetrahydrofolate cyclo-ligase [Myxococcota bacterium]
MKSPSSLLQEHKAQLRNHMRTLCRQANKQQQGQVVTQHFTALLRTCGKNNQHSCRVAGFVSLRDEIDLSSLHQWLQQHNMQHLVPHVLGEDLIFSTPQACDDSLPNRNISLQQVSQCCVLLVPGLAFDRSGNRLGRGRGFYDRFLSRLRKESRSPLIIGMCMEHQLVNKVPTQPHDQTVDAVCTAQSGILYCNNKAKKGD